MLCLAIETPVRDNKYRSLIGLIYTQMLLELPREHWPTFAAKAMLERSVHPLTNFVANKYIV